MWCSEGTKKFQIGPDALFDENFKKKGSPEEYGLRAPCIMDYLPSKKIFAKLIKFATLVENPLTEFNPKECKRDPNEK